MIKILSALTILALSCISYASGDTLNCKTCETLNPDLIGRQIEKLYSESGSTFSAGEELIGKLRSEPNSGHVGIATCSNYSSVFYLPLWIGVVQRCKGPFCEEKVVFDYVSTLGDSSIYDFKYSLLEVAQSKLPRLVSGRIDSYSDEANVDENMAKYSCGIENPTEKDLIESNLSCSDFNRKEDPYFPHAGPCLKIQLLKPNVDTKANYISQLYIRAIKSPSTAKGKSYVILGNTNAGESISCVF